LEAHDGFLPLGWIALGWCMTCYDSAHA